MLNLKAYYLMACQVDEESDKAAAANIICALRRKSPNQPCETPWGTIPLWRQVILESLMGGVITGAFDND